MNRKIILAAIGIALVTLGFVSGRFVQHSKSGYHYDVRATKDYDSPVGPIRWSYVTESVGMPFLDSGTTILELDGRMIYKAKRSFQESSPCARNIRATPEGVAWDDGDFLFDLTIHKIKTGKQAADGNPHQSLCSRCSHVISTSTPRSTLAPASGVAIAQTFARDEEL